MFCSKIGQNMTQPQRQVVQLDKIVQNYKPKSYHVHNVSTWGSGGGRGNNVDRYSCL